MTPSRRWIWLPIVVAVVIAAVVLPWNVATYTSHPQVVQDYAGAVQRVESMRSSETAALNPDCLVQLMTHGQQTDRVIVFVHGYTTCPQQFHQLGTQFYDLGYNVLIAPLPHHGLSDRLTTEQGRLTANELAAYADGVLDIAHGLGREVVMAGISAGGVTTAWAAQNRSDLDLAVIISPAFGFLQIPTPLTAAVMNVFSVLPDSYSWWDPSLQTNIGPPYAYPRYSRRALAQILRLGFTVQAEARRSPPAARRIILITNANEPSVNNEMTQSIGGIWRQAGANISFYEFPVDLQLPHDLIDPSQPDQRTADVYPTLIKLISQ